MSDELYALEVKHAELVDQFEAMRQQRDALQKQAAALQADARRYRWLRKHSGEFLGPEIFVSGKYELGSDLDAAIDAALKTTPAVHVCRWPDCACDRPVCGDADCTKRRHDASADCWCGPDIDYTDPETGASVYVHKEPQ